LGTPGDSGNLSINVGTGWWMCWRCSAKGRLPGVQHVLDGARSFAAQAASAQLRDRERWQLPEGFVSLRDPYAANAAVLQGVLEYLEARGVHQRIYEEAGLGAVLGGGVFWWRNRIVVPIHDALGVLRGYVGRTWYASTLPYMYPAGMQRGELLFNAGAIRIDTSEPLLVVEGVFDALPHWPYAVACLGKPTQAQYQLLLQARRPLAIALDRDAVDEGWALAQTLRLDGHRAACVVLPTSVKDPGELRPAELQHLVRNSLETW
jgi:hypothetical protein